MRGKREEKVRSPASFDSSEMKEEFENKKGNFIFDIFILFLFTRLI